MLNAAIYARYSTDKQREESIGAQFAIIEKYCATKGYRVVAHYADEAASGQKLAGRKQFLEMLDAAQKGAFDIIVFHKVDRAARNELDYYKTKDLLLRSGVRYEYAAQNIDSSPSGQLMEGVMVAFAANYVLNLKEETKKGMNENARNLIFNGGTPPLGYMVVDKHYAVNRDEAPIIQEIFRLYLAGNGYNKILAALNKKGYRTRKGEPFGKNSLHDILRNEKYIGTYTWGRVAKMYGGRRNSHCEPSEDFIRIPHAFEAIIDEEVFWKVQELMDNRKISYSEVKTEHPYLLTGLVICGNCGSRMVGQCVRKKYRNYICGNKDRKGVTYCHMKRIRCDYLENIVIDTIMDKVFDLNMEAIGQEIEKLYKQKQSAEDRLRILGKEKKALEKRLDHLYELLEVNGIDDTNINRLNAVKGKLNDLQAEIDKVKSVHEQPVPDQEQLMAIISRYKKMLQDRKNQEQLRLFVLACVESIEVFDTEIKINLSFNWKDRQHMLVPGTTNSRRVATLQSLRMSVTVSRVA